MRSLAGLLVVAVAIALSGCGGSGSSGGSTTPAPDRQLTDLDLVNILGPAPDTPDGANYGTSTSNTTLTAANLAERATTKEEKATLAALRKAGFVRLYQQGFNGALNTADSTAYQFRKPAGATSGMKVLEAQLSKPGSVSQSVTPIDAGSLGDESWASHLTGGGGEGAVFLWRRGSLVVVADMSCDDTCDFDVVKATRPYAAAIDARAKEIM